MMSERCSIDRLKRDTASELEPDDRHRPGQVTGGDVYSDETQEHLILYFVRGPSLRGEGRAGSVGLERDAGPLNV